MKSFFQRLLKFGFHLLYHQMAWSYDLIAATVSLGRWKKWVHTILPYIQGARILEVGYGPGHLQASLHQKGYHAHGLDASPQMGRMASHRLIRKGFQPRIIHGYAQYMPFSSSCFDTVVATFPSEYIFDQKSLSEIRRVLLPNGVLVVIPIAWPGNKSTLERITALAFRVTGQASGTPGEIPHGLVELFVEAGFSVKIDFVPVKSSTVMLLIAKTKEMR